MESIFGFLLIFMLSAVCWLLVLSKRFRHAMRRRRPGPLELGQYENEKEWLERQDALMQGIATIPAVIFSILFLLGIVVSAASLFK